MIKQQLIDSIDEICRFLIKIRVNNFAGKYKNTIFLSPLPYALGNFCEEIKYAIYYKSTVSRKLFILIPINIDILSGYKTFNIDIINTCRKYTRKEFGIIEYWSITLLYTIYFTISRLCYVNIIRHIIKGASDVEGIGYCCSFPRIGIREMWKYMMMDDIVNDRMKIKENIEEFIRILKKEVATSLLKQNIGSNLINNESKKVVVIHTRSSIYYKDGNRRNRNMDIYSYEEMIRDLLNNRDYIVVLIGDKNRLILEHESFINVPNYRNGQAQRSIELHYLLQSDIYIGTQSGPWDLALMLDKFIIGLNCIDITTLGISSGESMEMYAIKPLKDNITEEEFIKNKAYDLNNEDSINYFKFCHNSNFVHGFVSTMLDIYNAKPDNYTYNSQNYKLVPTSKIIKSREELIEIWKSRIINSNKYTLKRFFEDEINRLKTKMRHSNKKKPCNCFYSK